MNAPLHQATVSARGWRGAAARVVDKAREFFPRLTPQLVTAVEEGDKRAARDTAFEILGAVAGYEYRGPVTGQQRVKLDSLRNAAEELKLTTRGAS